MAGRVAVTVCPNCGAPVDRATIDANDPKCKYCNRPLPVEAPDAPEAPAISLTFESQRSASTSAPASGGRGAGIAIVVLVLVLVGVPVAILLATSASRSGSGLTSAMYGAPIPAGPAGSTGAADQVYIGLASGSSAWTAARVDVGRHKVVWRSAALEGEVPSRAIVASDAVVTAVSGATVVGLDPATGHERWRASLAQDPPTGCPNNCVALVGTHLVVLTRDGTVQSIDVTNGHQAWSTRLASTPRWLVAAGKSVAVDDRVSPTEAGHVLVVFDPASGASRRIAPQCPADPTGLFNQQRPSETEGYVFDQDGSAVTVLIEGTAGCAMRFRIADGSLVWQTQAAQGGPIPFTWTGESAPIPGSGSVVWTNSGTIYALNITDGTIRPLLTEKKQRYTLAGIVKGTVVVQAAPDFDSSKPAIWGVDLATGQRRWQIASRITQNSRSQKVWTGPATALIGSCQEIGSSGKCTFEAVESAGGSIVGTSSVPAGLIPDIAEASVSGSSLVANVDNARVAVIDLSTAAIRSRFP